jgi:signal peptidase I
MNEYYALLGIKDKNKNDTLIKRTKKDVFNNIKFKNKKLRIIQTKNLRNIIQPIEEQYRDNQNIIINGDEEHVKNPKDMNDLRKGLNKRQIDLLDDELDTVKRTTYNAGLSFNENNNNKIKVLEQKIEEKMKTNPKNKWIETWKNQINNLKK